MPLNSINNHRLAFVWDSFKLSVSCWAVYVIGGTHHRRVSEESRPDRHIDLVWLSEKRVRLKGYRVLSKVTRAAGNK